MCVCEREREFSGSFDSGSHFSFNYVYSCTLLMTMLPGTQLGSDKNKLTTTVLYELGVFLASLHCTLEVLSL